MDSQHSIEGTISLLRYANGFSCEDILQGGEPPFKFEWEKPRGLAQAYVSFPPELKNFLYTITPNLIH